MLTMASYICISQHGWRMQASWSILRCLTLVEGLIIIVYFNIWLIKKWLNKNSFVYLNIYVWSFYNWLDKTNCFCFETIKIAIWFKIGLLNFVLTPVKTLSQVKATISYFMGYKNSWNYTTMHIYSVLGG